MCIFEYIWTNFNVNSTEHLLIRHIAKRYPPHFHLHHLPAKKPLLTFGVIIFSSDRAKVVLLYLRVPLLSYLQKVGMLRERYQKKD